MIVSFMNRRSPYALNLQFRSIPPLSLNVAVDHERTTPFEGSN